MALVTKLVSELTTGEFLVQIAGGPLGHGEVYERFAPGTVADVAPYFDDYLKVNFDNFDVAYCPEGATAYVEVSDSEVSSVPTLSVQPGDVLPGASVTSVEVSMTLSTGEVVTRPLDSITEVIRTS